MEVCQPNMWRDTLRLGLAKACVALGLGIATVGCAASEAANEATLPLALRMQIAAQIRSDVDQYFAHWQGTGELDFDAAYKSYLDDISRTDDRRAFDLATEKLFALLANGHTTYYDKWLWKSSGPGTGLFVHYIDGRWIVLDSTHEAVTRGTVITSVDGQPIETFFADNSRYIVGSDALARRNHLFNNSPLFGMVFTVGTDDGRTIRIDRKVHADRWLAARKAPAIPATIAYVKIDGFDDPHYESDAVAYIRQHADAKALIVDVRGNNGGSTPVALIRALLTQPYRDWTEASALSVGMLKTYGGYRDSTNRKDDAETYGFDSALKNYFDRPMMYWPGPIQYPDQPIYKGQVIVLTDSDCASACEDFVMPMKNSHRATIVGDRTFGSSGQPFSRKISEDISYRIGAKRMFFGDGSPFEGVGIEPDVKVARSVEQFRTGEDPVLSKAIGLVNK